jgi:hypothetical protein
MTMSHLLWLHPPDAPAASITLDPSRAVFDLGRDEDNAVVLVHASVSRRHARLERDGEAFRLLDLDSKNGVRVGGALVADASLSIGEWFSIGDVFAMVERVSEAVRADRDRHATRRRTHSRLLAARLAAAQSRDALFAGLVAAFVRTAECRRGFVLAGDPMTGLVVRASHRLEPDEIDPAHFDGSRSAIDRALRERRLLLVGDSLAQPWMRQRASIIAHGIRALACAPLLQQGRIVGAVYADTDEAGKQFSQLDAELLDALAAQAGLALAESRLAERIADVEQFVAASEAGEVLATGPAPRWAMLDPDGFR